MKTIGLVTLITAAYFLGSYVEMSTHLLNIALVTKTPYVTLAMRNF